MKKLKVVVVPIEGTLFMECTTLADALTMANEITLKQPEESPEYELVFATPNDSLTVSTSSGLSVNCQQSLFDIDGKIDTLFLGGLTLDLLPQTFQKLSGWIKAHSSRIRRICFSGSGVTFALREGLIKSSNGAIHWAIQDSGFALGEDKSKLNPEPLFLRSGNVITCAGMSSVIDLSLMLIEEDCGREVAMQVAKMMVIYQRRPGSELQFSSLLHQQFSGKKQINAVQSWIKSNLHENLKIAVLADRAAMSPRNFSRVFLAQTGLSPGHYIIMLRLESSKRFLEETDLSVEQIAAQCGFGNADTMRKLYLRTFNLTPYFYRRNHKINAGANEQKHQLRVAENQGGKVVQMDFSEPLSTTSS